MIAEGSGGILPCIVCGSHDSVSDQDEGVWAQGGGLDFILWRV